MARKKLDKAAARNTSPKKTTRVAARKAPNAAKKANNRNQQTPEKPAIGNALSRQIEQRETISEGRNPGFPVVGIGASAGGRELTSAQEQLRALTSRIHDLQEEERAQLARELHDEFGAALTSLKLDLYWIIERLPQKTNDLEQKVRAMSELIDNTVDSVRQTAALLRPRLLDDFGLVAAIEWQCQEFEKRTGIRCTALLPQEVSLDRQLSTVFFRILQEALTNVTRHARATKVIVRLRLDSSNDKVSLEIKDNGIGMPLEATSNVKSFGLFGMRERAYAFGGHVRFTGRGGHGTTVTVEIPRGLERYSRNRSVQRELAAKGQKTSTKSRLKSAIPSSRSAK